MCSAAWRFSNPARSRVWRLDLVRPCCNPRGPKADPRDNGEEGGESRMASRRKAPRTRTPHRPTPRRPKRALTAPAQTGPGCPDGCRRNLRRARRPAAMTRQRPRQNRSTSAAARHLPTRVRLVDLLTAERPTPRPDTADAGAATTIAMTHTTHARRQSVTLVSSAPLSGPGGSRPPARRQRVTLLAARPAARPRTAVCRPPPLSHSRAVARTRSERPVNVIDCRARPLR